MKNQYLIPGPSKGVPIDFNRLPMTTFFVRLHDLLVSSRNPLEGPGRAEGVGTPSIRRGREWLRTRTAAGKARNPHKKIPIPSNGERFDQ